MKRLLNLELSKQIETQFMMGVKKNCYDKKLDLTLL